MIVVVSISVSVVSCGGGGGAYEEDGGGGGGGKVVVVVVIGHQVVYVVQCSVTVVTPVVTSAVVHSP